MFFKQYNLFTSMLAVLLVYVGSGLLAIGQSALLNKFKARESIQLVFTTLQLVITTFPLHLVYSSLVQSRGSKDQAYLHTTLLEPHSSSFEIDHAGSYVL